MKKINLLMLAIVSPFVMWSQQGINYQAAVRDGSGVLMVNQAVTAEFDIVETTALGAVVYSESHAVNTNDYGLINVVIGEGSVISGVFADIDWGSDLHFLNITIDGNDLGAVEFQAVPYAYQAENVRNIRTNTAVADIDMTSSDDHAKLELRPTANTGNDSSTVFMGEGSTPENGMAITYEGIGNTMRISGHTNGNPYMGPYLTIERDNGTATFSEGVVVEETTETPVANTVYGNSGPLAYGYFGGTTIFTDYGITSITNPSTGVYTVTLDNNWVGSPVVLVTSLNNSSDTEIATYSTTGTNEITVRIVDENNTSVNSNFSLLVFGLAL